ncbi:MAG: PEP-CTERM system histidine kinase PrsK [Gammaproteobacteria bacterium]
MIAGMLGYGLAAIAFAGLALLALASWRGRIEGGLLLLAVLLSAAWAGVSAWDVSTPGGLRFSPTLELLRDAAWLTFLGRVTPAGQGNLGALRRLLAFAPAMVVLVFGLPTTLGADAVQASPAVLRAMVYGGLISAIAAFVFLEQIYRGLRTDHRRAVRPLVIGIGGIFAYDLFLYSHAMLFQLLEPNLWAARGFVNLLAVPLLLLAARRNPSWSVDVFVSRHVTFYGTSLLGIGVYFLFMAVVGYWLKVLGREWGPVLQAVFFFGAGGLLAWTLFSPAARGRLKVFIAKHFYANKYDYREQWLGLTGSLSAPDADPDLSRRGLRALAELLEAEAGVLWQRRGAKSGDGLERTAVLGEVDDVPSVLSEDDAVVDFMKSRQWIVNVGEAVREPQSHPGLDLPDWVEAMDSRSLLVPLTAGETLWAVAALIRPRRVGKLNYEDIDLLRVAGTQVAAVLAQGEADRLLAESRQFEACNRFAASTKATRSSSTTWSPPWTTRCNACSACWSS